MFCELFYLWREMFSLYSNVYVLQNNITGIDYSPAPCPEAMVVFIPLPFKISTNSQRNAEISCLISLTSSSVTPWDSAFRCSTVTYLRTRFRIICCKLIQFFFNYHNNKTHSILPDIWIPFHSPALLFSKTINFYVIANWVLFKNKRAYPDRLHVLLLYRFRAAKKRLAHPLHNVPDRLGRRNNVERWRTRTALLKIADPEPWSSELPFYIGTFLNRYLAFSNNKKYSHLNR